MYDDTIKIIIIGDDSDETTSLTIRYVSGFFRDDLKLTIGVDFFSKTTNFNDKKIKLQIWTFGGEERFRFLLHQYCKGVRGGLFAFDIADSSSIAHIDDWLSVIRKEDGADIPILLVGIIPDEKNKRQVSAQEGKKIATLKNLNGYFECNLKTGENVGKAFEELIRLILADNDNHPPQKKAEDLFAYCYKCNLQLTKEEFLNHPCFTTGAVSLRGDINRGFNYLTTKERRKKEKKKKKRAKKERKIGERRRKEEYSTKVEGYLITYTRHLEKRLRNLETEKQLLDAERLRLEKEVNSLRNEIDRYKNI